MGEESEIVAMIWQHKVSKLQRKNHRCIINLLGALFWFARNSTELTKLCKNEFVLMKHLFAIKKDPNLSVGVSLVAQT
jgi:hypothetical protein